MRCSYCGCDISGKYYYDHLGNGVCERHISCHEAYYCSECGKIVAVSGNTIYDGRVICSDCRKYSLPPETPTAWFRDQAAAFLRSIGFEVDLTGVRIYNAASEFMNKYLDFDDLEGDLGFHMPFENDKNDIYIRSHMTKTHYTGVLVHELTHLWQHQNGFYNLPKPYSEGMSQLTSYFFYKAIFDAKKSQFAKYQMECIEQRTDADYGDGFRIAKKVYEEAGWDGIKYMAKKLSEGN